MPKPISPMETIPMHGFGTSVAAEDDDDGIPSMLAISSIFGQSRDRGRQAVRWVMQLVVQAVAIVETKLWAGAITCIYVCIQE